MSTCDQLDLEVLGSRLFKPPDAPGHCVEGGGNHRKQVYLSFIHVKQCTMQPVL